MKTFLASLAASLLAISIASAHPGPAGHSHMMNAHHEITQVADVESTHAMISDCANNSQTLINALLDSGGAHDRMHAEIVITMTCGHSLMKAKEQGITVTVTPPGQVMPSSYPYEN